MDNLVLLLWFIISLACVLCILKYKVTGTLNSIISVFMNLILPAITLRSFIFIRLFRTAKVLKFLLEWFPNSKVVCKLSSDPQNSNVNLSCTVADCSYHQMFASFHHEILQIQNIEQRYSTNHIFTFKFHQCLSSDFIAISPSDSILVHPLHFDFMST